MAVDPNHWQVGLVGYGEIGRILADEGVVGARATQGFARSADWRTEADRLLAHVNKD